MPVEQLTWSCGGDVFHSTSLRRALWIKIYTGQYHGTKCLLRPLKFLVFLALIHRS